MSSTVVLIRNGRACCGVQLSQPRSPVQRFARRELNRVLKKCFGSGLTGRHPLALRLHAGDSAADSFRVSRFDGGIEIAGANERSLLFGVYAFLKRYAGCRWFAPGEEITPAAKTLRVELDQPWAEAPTISRRYIFPEGGVSTAALMRKFIAWAPANAVGDITIDFGVWESMRDAVAPELAKRGLHATVSGHGLRMLVPRTTAAFRRHPEWFAKIGGERHPSGQYCFSDASLRDALCKRAAQFVRRYPEVRRLSIWAEDTSLNCECRACRQTGFLPSFASCINDVAIAVRRARPEVAVDFLAYNAALAWDMLEPAPGIEDAVGGMEIAYWGRDYRYRLPESPAPGDKRALRAVRRWRKLNPNSISILEYHTDIWMLTHLIPPLPHLIADDAKDYAALGVTAVGPLICLTPPGMDCSQKGADYASLTYPNLYFFAAFAWDAKQAVDAVLEDYARSRFGADADLCLDYLRAMERRLPVITSFNRSLFRLRFVDLWARDETPEEGGIQFLPSDWSPEVHWNAEEHRRFATCASLLRSMQRTEARNGWRFRSRDRGCRARSAAFRAEWDAMRDRLAAMHTQLRAQEALHKGRRRRAEALLQSALALPAGVIDTERVACREWLRRLRGS